MLDPEVPAHLRRGTVEGQASVDEQHHRVAEVDVVERVGDQHHRLALVAQLPQQEHERLLQAWIQAAGGLVEEEQGGLGEQLGGDGDALALAARQAVDGRLRAVGQLEGGHHLQHALAPLAGGGVGGQAQPRRVLQAARHRQLAVHDVVLGHVADVSALR